MVDSQRAAHLALDRGLDVGLHVNLSEAFSGEGVPDRVREAQDRVRGFLKAYKYALVVFNPFLATQFRLVVEAQLAEFHRLYDCAPTHLDGHQHFHLATNVIAQRLLPEGTRVRRSFTFGSNEKSLLNRWYRKIVDGRLLDRHRVTDQFYALSNHLAPDRLQRVMAAAEHATVELMTHPEQAPEFELLMSDAFAEALSTVGLLEYSAL